MSAGFRAVQWNRAKLVYDGILLVGVVLYIGAYLTLVYWLEPPKDQLAAIDIRIRALGTCAFLMLTMILSIGPLTRLDRRFLPLLYNRRHFGVLTFFVVRRSQRSVHRALWPILALAVALGLAMALALRAPPEVQAPQATEGLKP